MKFGEESNPTRRRQFSIAGAMSVIAILGVLFSFGMEITTLIIGGAILTIALIFVLPGWIAAIMSDESVFLRKTAVIAVAFTFLFGVLVILLLYIVVLVVIKLELHKGVHPH